MKTSSQPTPPSTCPARRTPSHRSRLMAIVAALALPAPLLRADVTLVADRRAQAVIVLPTATSAVEQYAAEELAYHVEKATGVRLATMREDAVPAAPAGRVFIGKTRVAAQAGIDFATLAREALVLRTTGGALLVAGEDTDGDPLAEQTRCGTLWGVYELLDRYLGARWLWPGELGTHVPPRSRVAIPEVDLTLTPTMIRRRVRDGLVRSTTEAGLTKAGFNQYAHAQKVFQRRHRMGSSLPLTYGHAFESWWKRHGREHPEWFQLLPDGRRGPATPTAHTSMCVSNPAFQRQVVAQWQRARTAAEGRWLNVNGCENDIGGLCGCAQCLAWDGPQPELSEIYPLGDRRMVSDRYARFWLALQQLAAQEDPAAKVVGYAYFNYYPAPTSGVRLNRNVLVGMCPWPGWWFPRTDAQQAWLKEQWAGWSATGASVFLRPNYFLDSYTMPHVFAHQFADEFQHYARHGMVATDFDSLTGQWAAQGTNLYLLFRLHRRTDQPVDELLDEYYSAFGAAASHVRRYFDYWEAHTMADRDRFNRAQRAAGVSRYRNFAAFAHVVFPTEVFPPAEAILREAAAAARNEPTSAARVEFLQQGFEHARLCRQLAALNAGTDSDLSPLATRRLHDELVAFRRRTEGLFLANYNRCAAVEERSWSQLRQAAGYDGAALRPLAPQPAPLAGAPAFSLRHEASFVAPLEVGQRFRAKLAARPVGKAVAPVQWRLFGPDDRLVEKGQVATGRTVDLDIAARQAGVHLLVVRSGQTRALVTLLSPHAALAGRTVQMISQTSPMFFHVPAGTARFQLTLRSPAPGETARLRVIDPAGREAALVQTGDRPEVVAAIKVPRDAAGRAWQVRLERADRGILEDYSLSLDGALPGFWSHAPDRLVGPAP